MAVPKPSVRSPERTTTNRSAPGGEFAVRAPTSSARVEALRLLAARRLTQSQLWQKLEAKGYGDDAIADAVICCKRDGYLDDTLYATLYVEGARKAVGDARLVAELVKRGIDREAAQRSVAAALPDQDARLRTAYAKLMRTKPAMSFQSAARSLERLGFPTSSIYRLLREHAQTALNDAIVDHLARGCAPLEGSAECAGV